MCTPKRCLPLSFYDFHLLRHRSSASKRKHGNRRPVVTNPININQVSEDELLLLPGINRALAKNIIDYREKHNGFKDIDELVHVDGITSHLLGEISIDLITSSSVDTSSHNRKELIDLNFASYDELCSVAGLTSSRVKRIIQHRERRGFFRSIEDLLKIKGINRGVLETIHPFLMIDHEQIRTSISNPSLNNLHSIINRNDANAKDALSIVSLLLETLPTEFQTKLVTSLSTRPTCVIHKNNNKQNSFRFASWNLQELTNEKIQNPGVREVICRAILENNFSLIAIQEIGSKQSLNAIAQELNSPTIPLVKNWPNRPRGNWKSIVSDVSSEGSAYLGFLYNELAGIEIRRSSTLPFTAYFNQLPFIAIFRLFNKYDLVFVNIHLKAKGSDESGCKKDEARSLSVLAQAMKNTIEQKRVIIVGHFDNVPTASEFEALVKCNYSYVIQQNTDISLQTPQGSICLDNIWLSEEANVFDTGHSGVIRNNLTSVWIPAGWTWGGLVSDHCPIWMDLNLS
ncbi:unnamed protein product [Rotaria magnacalcarata]|uniref:Endonuclease/exonuclease/phosphatase family domain-containing protein 1 n=2 Tax=Rotaria magnacalcarata TaxID=392030 RepID=A0A816RH06_9BILA|nr:unnamed protein product [Rotaria magnacalcarata]CAF4252322.1 unnamed protein product [Rotaria magnacalcarata]